VEQGPPNVPEFEPAFPGQTRAPAVDSGLVLAAEEIVPGLEHPWGIAVLPGGDLLVTERPGRLRAVQAGRLVEAPVAGLPEVHAVGQGGLLDVAAGPDFEQDRLIYWTYAKPLGDGTSATAAARGRLAEDYSKVTEVEDIFVQEPGSPSAKQYGSRILFGGDGDAFVTTGEHFTPEERVFAQDLDKTYGKVVRIGLDGSVPADNPFVDEEGALGAIWSYGHRNVQGADIHPLTGQLWTIEHGPQGGDELNKIAPGANYGWPVVSYGENYDGTPVGSGEPAADGMTQPRYYWDPVIAPGGMLFYEGAMFDWEGDLLIASLTPGAVVRLEMQGDTVTGEERLLTGQGRIRDLAVAPDGALLALTDADDGAVLRLTPEAATTN
jgi:glucose/arabinose dehydrogenase